MKDNDVTELKYSLEDWEWKLYNMERDGYGLNFDEMLKLRQILLNTLKFMMHIESSEKLKEKSESINNIYISNENKLKLLKFITPEEKKRQDLVRHIIENTKSF